MTGSPALWSATRLAEAIREGSLTSSALLEIYLDRIERLDGVVNAVVTRDFEAARVAAREADAAVARGDALGPLHGLPVTVKDALETKGLRSTGGAVELTENVPRRDAPVVKAIRDAGAIVIGKTNLPRWSGDIQAYNEIFGTTNNPWNPARVPGGSSGGAAAAVACGFTAFEIGTDIGGSIRFPSAFCGVFGHKPSFGIVPATGYLDHEHGGTTEADVNVVGPIARSADDLALLLGLLLRRQGPWSVQLEAAAEEVSSLRVAAWLDDEFCRVDREVLEKLDEVVGALEADGISVNRTARPDIDPGAASNLALLLIASAISQAFPDNGFTHRAWLEAHREREAIREKWAEFFEEIDVLLAPVSFVPPFEHLQEGNVFSRTLTCNNEERPYLDVMRWTMLVGMAYLPSTVPPIGTGKSGLPIGVQVVGRYGADHTTIAFAKHVAELMGGYAPPPMAR